MKSREPAKGPFRHEPEEELFEAEEAGVAPPKPKPPGRAADLGKEAAGDVMERCEKEYPPIGGEFDRTPPTFERD